MSRFLIIAADGETIAGVLSMSESDALLNIEADQTLLAVDPLTDNCAAFLHDSVIVDLTAPSPVFIDVVTNEPSEDANLTDISLALVT